MKKKLSLTDLKVESFITSENSKNQMGGAESIPTNCCTGYSYGTCMTKDNCNFPTDRNQCDPGTVIYVPYSESGCAVTYYACLETKAVTNCASC